MKLFRNYIGQIILFILSVIAIYFLGKVIFFEHSIEIKEKVVSFYVDFKNFSLSDFNLSILYDYLDTLTLLEEYTLFNIIILLTLAVFFSVFRIILYFFSIYYLDKYNIYDRYPKYQKWIKRMEKIRAYSIFTEIIIFFVLIILMLSLCVFMLWVLLQ